MADVITQFKTTELDAINEILASVGQGPVPTLDDTNPDVAIIQRTLKQISKEVQSEGWSFNREFQTKNVLQPPKTADWAKDTYYNLGDTVMNGGNLYECTTAGDSVDDATKGPTGTGSGITDHQAKWQFIITGNKTKIIVTDNILQADLSDPLRDYDPVVRWNDDLKKRILYDRANHTDRWDATKDWEWDVTFFYNFLRLPAVVQDYIVARSATTVSARIVGDMGQYQILQQKEAYCRAMSLEYECNQGDYTFFGHSKNKTKDYYDSYKPYLALER